MYRYAIIGFGGLGKLHLGNLIKLERERGDIKLCALCGADPNTFKSNVKGIQQLNATGYIYTGLNVDNYTVVVRSIDGKSGIVPERRNYKNL